MQKSLVALTALVFAGCLVTEEPPPPAEEITEAEVLALSAQTTEALRTATLIANGFGALLANPPAEGQMHLDDSQLPAGSGEAGMDGMGGGGDGAPEPMIDGDGEGAGASCSTLEWNLRDPLRVTVHLDACPAENGETLTGSASLFLRHEGDEGSLGVDADLRTESWSLVGFFVVTAEPGQLRFDVDIDYAGPEGAVRLALEGATIEALPAALVLNGSGTITADGETWAADMMDVSFTNAECTYPTSGSADLTIPDSPPITLVFAEEDGMPVVWAQISVLPPIPYYPTC